MSRADWPAHPAPRSHWLRAFSVSLALSMLLFTLPSASSVPSSSPDVTRKAPLFPSQQESDSTDDFSYGYDTSTLDDDDIDAFEEKSALESESQENKIYPKVLKDSANDLPDLNELDFPNYYDAIQTKPLIDDTESNILQSGLENNVLDEEPYDFNNIAETKESYLPNEINNLNKNDIDSNISLDLETLEKEAASKKERSHNSNKSYLTSTLDDDAIVQEENNEAYESDFDQIDQVFKERKKRNSEQTLNKTKTKSRVVTGDTVLNIEGAAVRDVIADAAGAGAGAGGSATRLDTFVIRSSGGARPRPDPTHSYQQDAIGDKEEEDNSTLAVVGAHVTLPCRLRDTTNVSWYRDNELVASTGSGESGGSAGTATSFARVSTDGALQLAAARGRAGQWACRSRIDNAAAPPITLTIYERVRSVWLGVDARRRLDARTWLPASEGTALTLACTAEGGVPVPRLWWRVVSSRSPVDISQHLTHNRTVYHEGVTTSYVTVLATRALHNASVLCEARQPAPAGEGEGGGTTGEGGDSASLTLHVTYPPSFIISRRPGFGRALWAGAAAALRCEVDANPPARPAWRRDHDNQTLTQMSLGGGGGGGESAAELRWAALRAEHAGWYRCTTTHQDTPYSSIGYYLLVRAPDTSSPPTEEVVREEPEHEKVDVPLGGNVQLNCPKGTIGCWAGRTAAGFKPVGSKHAHGVLAFSNIMYSESGEYRCVGASRDRGDRLTELKRVTLTVHGGATAVARAVVAVGGAGGVGGWRLQCLVCGAGVIARWVSHSRALPAALSPAPAASSAVPCYTTELLVTHSDEVWCVSRGAGGGGAVAVFPARAAPRAAPALSSAAPPPPHARNTSHIPLAAAAVLVLYSYTRE